MIHNKAKQLGCSYSVYTFSIFVSKDTTKLGLMLQYGYEFLTGVYEIFTGVYETLQVSMRNRHLFLTNQIAVFVTIMI